jgi:hypothetical protein
MSLNKEIDKQLDQFIKENFILISDGKLQKIKKHLVNFIKEDIGDKLTGLLAKKESPDSLIEIACQEYVKQVNTYKNLYYENESATAPSLNKLLSYLFSRFYNSINGCSTGNTEEKIKKFFSSANFESIKYRLEQDNNINVHAGFLLDSLPYDVCLIRLLDEILEGFVKEKLLELSNEPIYSRRVMWTTRVEIGIPDLLAQLEQAPNIAHSQPQQNIQILAFLRVLWQKIKSLFISNLSESGNNPLFFQKSVSTNVNSAIITDEMSIEDNLSPKTNTTPA